MTGDRNRYDGVTIPIAPEWRPTVRGRFGAGLGPLSATRAWTRPRPSRSGCALGRRYPCHRDGLNGRRLPPSDPRYFRHQQRLRAQRSRPAACRGGTYDQAGPSVGLGTRVARGRYTGQGLANGYNFGLRGMKPLTLGHDAIASDAGFNDLAAATGPVPEPATTLLLVSWVWAGCQGGRGGFSGRGAERTTAGL